MQAQEHGDLSTKPAANHKSGRVQTMFEENDQEGQNNNNPEEMGEYNEMAALLAQSSSPISIKRGDVVEGVIVRIDQDEILVDIGLKSEGVLSTKELPANGYGSFNELHINDKVLVYVIQPETQDGHALLSLKRANAERQWRIAEEQYKNGELLKARVIDYNKGGLIVDVSGIRGFVPISQILNLKRIPARSCMSANMSKCRCSASTKRRRRSLFPSSGRKWIPGRRWSSATPLARL